MLGLHQQPTKRRFNLLFLEEGEVYIEDFGGFLHIPGIMEANQTNNPSISQSNSQSMIPVPFSLRQQLKGRLHLTTRALVFEPASPQWPILRFLLKNFVFLQRQKIKDSAHVSATDLLSFFVKEYTCIQPNQPYVIVKVDPTLNQSINSSINQLINPLAEYCVTLQYTALNKLMPLIQKLYDIWTKHTAREIDRMIDSLIDSIEQSIDFDTSMIVDLRERILLSNNQPIPVQQINPLSNSRGQMLITDARIYFQPYQSLNQSLSQSNNQSVNQLAIKDIKRVYKRRYGMRDVGIEFFFPIKNFVDCKNGKVWPGVQPHNQPSNQSNNQSNSSLSRQLLSQRSVFFTFETKNDRDLIFNLLINQASYQPHAEFDLAVIQNDWLEGKLSNFDYLMFLNQVAGRSFADLCQYPVFPWVLQDYSSSALDFNNQTINPSNGQPNQPNNQTFRDLSKPIGALNSERLAVFKKRMRDMPSEMGTPFLYGSFYSTPGYVLYYLVRRAPQYQLKLQSGRFDQPDRLFCSLGSAWTSVLTGPADVKELIPEFFLEDSHTGDFLVNELGLDLGVRQNGVEVDDVELPKWASDHKDFVRKNRMALESEYVSKNLNLWIDLIFGYKQTGEEAVRADNVFYPLVYEGHVDLDAITDPVEKKSLEAQINEFGQAPKKIFTQPHPQRKVFNQSFNQSINQATKSECNSSDLSSPRGRWAGKGARQPSMDWTIPVEQPQPVKQTIKQPKVKPVVNSVSPSKEIKSSSNQSVTQPTIQPVSQLRSEPIDRSKTPTKIIQPSTSPSIEQTNNQSNNQPVTHPFTFSMTPSPQWKGDLSQLKRSSIQSIHKDQVTGVAISEDLSSCLTIGADCYLRVSAISQSNIQSNNQILFESKLGDVTLTCLCLLNPNTAVVGAWDGRIHCVPLNNPSIKPKSFNAHDDAVSGLGVWNSMLVSASWDSTIKMFPIRDSMIDVSSAIDLAGHEAGIRALSINQSIACTGDEDGQIYLWDLKTERKIASASVGGHEITAITNVGSTGFLISSSDLTLALVTFDGRVQWHNKVASLVLSMACDGERAVCGDQDGCLRIWDVKQGRELTSEATHAGALNAFALNDAGNMMVAGMNRAKDNVGVWRG